MKKLTIFSLVVGILLATANVSFARDGNEISKTDVIPKIQKAPEQPAIDIITVAPDAIVVDVCPTKDYAEHAVTSYSDASSLMIKERFSPAEVPRLCGRQWRYDLGTTTTLHFAPHEPTKIWERRINILTSEGYQVKKE